MYLHEKENWTDFYWEQEKIALLLDEVTRAQGRLYGRLENLGFENQLKASAENLWADIIGSSEIEGIRLNKEEVRSSIARKLGIENKGQVPSSHYVDSVVSVALGDNQASFLGSVGPEERLLLNVGTGSQISAYTDRLIETGEAECRPYLGETWLIAGSPLCGGYAYSLLKRFVEEIFEMEGTAPADSIYELLNRWAGDVYEQKKREVQVDTRFNGSRKDPGLTGGIFGLTEESFHLGQFALGTLKGICEDLYRYYREFPREVRESTGIVGSGNGIRMNPLLQKICSERFGKEMKIPRYSEEAGYGTALFSLLAGGYYRSLKEVQARIRYE